MNTDTIALLDKYFDLAITAPDGIKRLRETILTLAMQGKLVPQDPKDQPASELLKEIETEKQRLVKEGKIKEPKALPPIMPKEVPYEVPKSWEWVRLGEIGNWRAGSTPNRANTNYYGGKFPWVKSGEVKQGIIRNTEEFVTDKALNECSLTLNPVGSVLVAMYGANIGDVGVLNIEATTNQAVCACSYLFGSDTKYLLFFLQSIKNDFIERGAGAAQPNISKEKIVATLFPLPPLAEQHRIVAKIDELMARLDELERKQDARNERRLAMHQAAVSRLIDVGDANASRAGRDFIIAHFGELYGTKENVADLRKAILQLAVMGRLVPQNTQDQPASELLKEIETEKKRLVQEGKIKEPKPLPPIKSEEAPYEVPDSWAWVRLGEFVVYNGRLNVDSDSISKDAWILDLEDIEKNTSRLLCRAKYKERQSKSSKSIFCKGDVLYGKLRPYLDKVIVANEDGYCTTEIVPIIPLGKIDPFYIRWLLKRPSFIHQVNALSYGVKMPRLGTKDAINSVHPLPPLAEQKQIVAKIDELMALCDELEQKIDERTAKESALLEAVAARA